jgi:hypothetical protein
MISSISDSASDYEPFNAVAVAFLGREIKHHDYGIPRLQSVEIIGGGMRIN